MMVRHLVAVVAVAGLAGCGAGAGPSADCVGGETLVDMDGEIVVFTNDCGNGTVRTRPATPEDLARLEAPL